MKTEQTNTSDPQLGQQFGAKTKRFDEACNNNDAAAIAAFFTEDAVLVTETGLVCGRKAIEKSFADLFQKWRVSHHIRKRDQYSPRIIGTAGNEMWATGVWSAIVQGQSGGPSPTCRQASGVGPLARSAGTNGDPYYSRW
jgi:ketosteroid isomerase-like protein